MKHMIKAVTPGSIAEELEIEPGDTLLSINGQHLRDVLDYRFSIQDSDLLIEIMKPSGEIWELEIEKDEPEDLGIIFHKALMDHTKRCQNRCVFCFIDQMPPHMRRTLYVKDDDPRLSFLMGNYITLTNLTHQDVQRIAHYHLSPLHISVHAADPELRRQITRNPRAGSLTKILRVFNEAGIQMHFQIVLCKGLNDGDALDETIETLLRFKPGAASLSVVPVGLTSHRDGLYPLEPFTAAESAAVIRQVEHWQHLCLKEYRTAFVFCADEFYIGAGIPLPPYRHYEGFPQLENGVGMTALFERRFTQTLRKATATMPCPAKPVNIAIVTGRSAEGFMREMANLFMTQYPLAHLRVYGIENRFFGENITVSGLLTGRDIIAQLQKQAAADQVDGLFIPQNAFRSETRVMLDDTTFKELRRAFDPIAVKIGNADGRVFCRQLLRMALPLRQ